MIAFLAPAWLTLAIPLLFIIWKSPTTRRSSNILRTLIGLIFIAALARPYLQRSSPGRHVMVLVDRSLSMPADSDASALETLRLMEAERKSGDHLGVIAFAARPRVERLASEDLKFAGFTSEVNTSGTDLAAAIAMGIDWIPEGSQGSLVIISDGEATGRDPLPEARRAAARGLRIDLLPKTHDSIVDTSVENFSLPERVDAGEPFQFDAWVFSDENTTRDVILRRGQRILSRGPHQLKRGMNRLIFRDILGSGGIATYSLDVIPQAGQANDRRPENDHGLGAVLVNAPAAVLVLNESGAPSTISETLRAAGIPVTVSTPEVIGVNRVSLTAYRAVILENIAANRLGYQGMFALADFVTERGGGLLMTGGRASFGIGGYHLSPLDKLLPVSMEMRNEARKLGVAIAMVLDRSGSMGASVGGGKTKMDLANSGASAAIDMLSNIDSVTVIAVDQNPHEIVALQAVNNSQTIGTKVRTIRSQGGGIYTYNGLLAAGKALEGAPQQNRHIILFADAADAEQPEGVPKLLKQFETLGITVSVIALGEQTDSDAEFLRQVADQGLGEIYFTTIPEDLPRLFAMDTMAIARSTFIEEPTPTKASPGLFAMGEFGLTGGEAGELLAFPTVDGYNLTFARPEATVGAATVDEFNAPFFALAQRGVGRVAAFTGQAGGTYGQAVINWPSFGDFLVSTTRYLMGSSEPEDLFATATLEGAEAVVRIQVDRVPGDPAPDTSKLDLHMTLGDGSRRILPLRSVSEGFFEARVPITEAGVAVGSIHIPGDKALSLPPVALPFSPEFKRIPDPNSGTDLLASLAKATGGGELVSLAQTFDGPRQASRWRVITQELLIAGLLLMLFEIAARRLDLLGALPARTRPQAGLEQAKAPRAARQKRASKRPESSWAQPQAIQPSASHKPKDAPITMAEALERAQKKANKRLGR